MASANQNNLISGLIVYLVSLPMSIGIALACGLPLMTGIISASIGGLVVGILSDSEVSVSGPAAGLITLIIYAYTSLGSIEYLFIAILIAGVIQLLLSIIKLGFLAEYIPTNVIQGIMSGIGFIIIIKQIPIIFGGQIYDIANYNEILTYSTISWSNVLITIPIFILLYFYSLEDKIFKVIPIPFAVILIGSASFILLKALLPELATGTIFINSSFHFTKDNLYLFKNTNLYNAFLNPQVYYFAGLIALMSSTETILNLKVSQRLDTLKRRASSDKELFAQGIGNVLAGFLGALPVVSLVARTSLNIKSGATSKVSTIINGGFILLTIILIPMVLNFIPLSSLATLLVYVGYNLCSPEVFYNAYKQGSERFSVFILSMLGIVFIGFEYGMMLGMILSIFYVLRINSLIRFDIYKEHHSSGEVETIVLPQHMTFLNKAGFVDELDKVPSNIKLVIDARYSTYIDSEILYFINEFKQHEAKNKNIALNLIGFKNEYQIHDHADFINIPTVDTLANLSPCDVLNILIKGNERFLNESSVNRNVKADIEFTQDQQHPIAAILGCIDSRVPVETVFDMGFGELFCARVAGNISNVDIVASLEYATKVVGSKLIVVLGHTSCGAIKAACNNVKLGNITKLLDVIEPALSLSRKKICGKKDSTNNLFVDSVTDLNIANTICSIFKSSYIIQELITKQEIAILGAVYDVTNGEVNFYNYSSYIYELSNNSKDDFDISNLLNSMNYISKQNNIEEISFETHSSGN